LKKYRITIRGKVYEVEIKSIGEERASVLVNGVSYEVDIEKVGIEGYRRPSENKALTVESAVPKATPPTTPQPLTPTLEENSGWKIVAPMSGLIIDLLVKEGDRVKAGDLVLKIEAMKMENDINSPSDGLVKRVMVSKGMEVREGDMLIELAR